LDYNTGMDALYEIIRNNLEQFLLFLSTLITMVAGAATTVFSIQRKQHTDIVREQLRNLYNPLYMLLLPEIGAALSDTEEVGIDPSKRKAAMAILSDHAYLAPDEVIDSLSSEQFAPLGAKELYLFINKEFHKCCKILGYPYSRQTPIEPLSHSVRTIGFLIAITVAGLVSMAVLLDPLSNISVTVSEEIATLILVVIGVAACIIVAAFLVSKFYHPATRSARKTPDMRQR